MEKGANPYDIDLSIYSKMYSNLLLIFDYRFCLPVFLSFTISFSRDAPSQGLRNVRFGMLGMLVDPGARQLLRGVATLARASFSGMDFGVRNLLCGEFHLGCTPVHANFSCVVSCVRQHVCGVV